MKLPVRHRQQQSRELSDNERNDSLSRLFNDDLFQPFFNWQPFLGFEMMRPMRRMISQVENWLPRTDVSENDKELKVALDIPHVDPKNVDVAVEEDSLIVSRVIDLPAGVEADKITAEAKHGTLYITIPKKPDAQRKQIKIDVKD